MPTKRAKPGFDPALTLVNSIVEFAGARAAAKALEDDTMDPEFWYRWAASLMATHGIDYSRRGVSLHDLIFGGGVLAERQQRALEKIAGVRRKAACESPEQYAADLLLPKGETWSDPNGVEATRRLIWKMHVQIDRELSQAVAQDGGRKRGRQRQIEAAERRAGFEQWRQKTKNCPKGVTAAVRRYLENSDPDWYDGPDKERERKVEALRRSLSPSRGGVATAATLHRARTPKKAGR